MTNSEGKDSKFLREKLLAYLGYLDLEEDMGLIIAESDAKSSEVISTLREAELSEAKDWKDIMKNLSTNTSTFYVLGTTITKEIYDIVAQFYKRAGTIQVMDKQTMDLKSATFNKEETSFVIVATEKNLKIVEEKFSIRDKVGITERF